MRRRRDGERDRGTARDLGVVEGSWDGERADGLADRWDIPADFLSSGGVVGLNPKAGAMGATSKAIAATKATVPPGCISIATICTFELRTVKGGVYMC